MCFRFLKPFHSYFKNRNYWSTWNRIQIVFFLYIKSIIIREHLQFLFIISSSSLLCSSVIYVLGISSSQSTSSLYLILLVNFQMSTITYTLMIFNSIPSYLTPPIYYKITHNYVNVHQLSDHSFCLTTFYLTLQNLHSKISHLTIIIFILLSLTVFLSSHPHMF